MLSHAHFDHLDTRTLKRFGERTTVVTAKNTRDILGRMRFRDVTELRWGETLRFVRPAGELLVRAFRVNHWGARVRRDTHRGWTYSMSRSVRSTSRTTSSSPTCTGPFIGSSTGPFLVYRRV